MDLVIKALTPDLVSDYLDFFDHRAFADESPFYPCYCNAFNLSREQIRRQLFVKAEQYGGEEGWRRALRESALQMVQNGSIRGYLAYDGDLSVGWCNANDRLSYYRVGEFDLDSLPEDSVLDGCVVPGNVKSIVCFEIAPAWRGKGIAGRLLEQVCKDAAEEGFSFAEAYPEDSKNNTPAFTGPLRLYEKAGFTEYGRRGSMIIMRKVLQGQSLV